jgi:hypothetical protein
MATQTPEELKKIEDDKAAAIVAQKAIDDAKPTEKKGGIKTPEAVTVTMSAEEYQTLIAKITDLSAKVDSVSDKDRLDRFEAKQRIGKTVLPIAGVSSIDGAIIVGWRTVTNEAEFRNGIYFENQIIEVTFRDGSVKKMEYREFSRNKQKISGEIVARQKDIETDKELITIKFPDGDKVTVGIEFIN